MTGLLVPVNWTIDHDNKQISDVSKCDCWHHLGLVGSDCNRLCACNNGGKATKRCFEGGGKCYVCVTTCLSRGPDQFSALDGTEGDNDSVEEPSNSGTWWLRVLPRWREVT